MIDFLEADWPAPANVRTLLTTRAGGVSVGPYARLNLADHVGDDQAAVATNRARLRAVLPAEPLWLEQVHGTRVLCADDAREDDRRADASVTRQAGRVLAILTADCLPVLFCDRAGSVVAAAHAGWRGLAAGVLKATVEAMACPPDELLAFLGPAIAGDAYQVGEEVRAAFLAADLAAAAAFSADGAGHWRCDLYALARLRLARIGLTEVHGGRYCTFSDAEHFFSYRRTSRCGRQASLIWLDDTRP